MKKIIPMLLMITVFLTACGGNAAPPTMTADIPGTAVAAAQTMVAQTLAAIPTNTLPPPTETASPTLEPTLTPNIPPTLEIPATSVFSVAPTSTSSGGDCSGTLDLADAGPTKNVRVENQSGGSANVGLYLQYPNAFGQCGAYTLGAIDKNGKVVIRIPNGQWYAYAWITLKKGQSSYVETTFFLGESKTDDMNRLVIKEQVMVFVGP